MPASLISAARWSLGLPFFLVSTCFLLGTLAVSSRQAAYRSARVLFRILNRIMGIDLTVIGHGNIIPGRTCILMGNHQSLFDVFVVPVAIPFPFVGVEADYHFRWPVWGWLIKAWGNIPIHRESRREALASIREAEDRLRQGVSIGILPEGHRTRDGKLGRFKKGPFHMALNTRAPILPFGIRGLFEYCPKGSCRLKPGKVQVSIGVPIPFNVYGAMDVDSLKEYVRREIHRLSTG